MNFLRRIIGLILISSFLTPSIAVAGLKNEGIRSPISYDESSKMCQTGPFAGALDQGSKDYNFELSNSHCIAFMAGFGSVLMLNQAITTAICKPTPGTGPTSEGLYPKAAMGPPLPWPTPTSMIKAGMLVSMCAARSTDLGAAQLDCASGSKLLCPAIPLITNDMLRCCPSVLVLGAALSAATVAILAIWGVAERAYNTSRICGHDWEEWYQEKDGSDQWVRSDGTYQKCLKELFVYGGAFDVGPHNQGVNSGRFFNIGTRQIEQGYVKKNLRPTAEECRAALSSVKAYGNDDLSLNNTTPIPLNLFLTGSSESRESIPPGLISVVDGVEMIDRPWILKALGFGKPKIQNRWYRDFLYGGIEYEDDSCTNITESGDPEIDTKVLIENFGYNSNYQRYYMRGANISSNYACERFIMGSSEFRDNASSAYNCCRKRGSSTICIEAKDTYETTNYYHRFCDVGEGCNVGNVNYKIYNSKESNYLCAKTYSVCPYNHNIGGGTEDYELVDGTTDKKTNFCQFRNHCVKKYISPKMQEMNLGDNPYLSSACRDLRGDAQNFLSYESDIIPIKGRHFSAPIAQCVKETMNNFLNNLDGVTGQKITDRESVLSKIQTLLRDAIRVALMLSVVFFGVTILIGAPAKSIDRKTLMIYLMKMTLVFYFATGDGWQEGFSSGVLNISTMLSDLTFRVDETGEAWRDNMTQEQLDQIDLAVSSGNTVTRDSLREVHLDGCQFPRYKRGKDPNQLSYPENLGYLRIFDTLDCKIVRALGYGMDANVPNLVLMLISGFFTGGLAIIFFIGTMMFALFLIALTIKALHIFLMSTISIALLIFVSPITITCAMFGKTKNIFQAWLKQLMGFSLQPMILFAYLGIMITVFDQVIIGKDVTFVGDAESGKVLECNSRADQTSIYCIFKIADISKAPFNLDQLGIALPILGSMDGAKLNTITKAAIIMFIFSKFMDQISTFATSLVGGANLGTGVWNASATGAAMKARGAMRAVQKRVNRASIKVGKGAVSKGSRAGSVAADIAGDRGKAVKEETPDSNKGGDHVISSKDSEGGDSAGGGDAVKDDKGDDGKSEGK